MAGQENIPLREVAGRRQPLPVPRTSFVGRDREVADVADLLRQDDIRLVTLTGPGGAGKTRIALRVAEEVAPEFEGGVVFVGLAPVRDVGLFDSCPYECKSRVLRRFDALRGRNGWRMHDSPLCRSGGSRIRSVRWVS